MLIRERKRAREKEKERERERESKRRESSGGIVDREKAREWDTFEVNWNRLVHSDYKLRALEMATYDHDISETGRRLCSHNTFGRTVRKNSNLTSYKTSSSINQHEVVLKVWRKFAQQRDGVGLLLHKFLFPEQTPLRDSRHMKFFALFKIVLFTPLCNKWDLLELKLNCVLGKRHHF